ncbi:hypothetical protein [Nostoc sp.]|uniref:hypothetical protein n=1 Tax=Nostoc sp. TaxID=1180 RepID=UPI002FF97055
MRSLNLAVWFLVQVHYAAFLETMECSFEKLLVALADNLWKGKRNTQLEDIVIKSWLPSVEKITGNYFLK